MEKKSCYRNRIADRPVEKLWKRFGRGLFFGGELLGEVFLGGSFSPILEKFCTGLEGAANGLQLPLEERVGLCLFFGDFDSVKDGRVILSS